MNAVAQLLALATLGASLPDAAQGSPNGPVMEFRGVLRKGPARGLAFCVANDAKRISFVLYDATDGTPIVLSDRYRTLVYAPEEEKVVLLQNSRGVLNLTWTPEADISCDFSASVEYDSYAPNLDRLFSDVSVAGFLESCGRESPAHGEFVTGEHAGGIIDAYREDAHGFWFSSKTKGCGFAKVDLGVDRSAVWSAAHDFPDIDRLRRDLPELIVPESPRGYLAAHKSSPRLKHASGATYAEAIAGLAGGPDADEFRRRDQDLGRRYCDALAKQGICFPPILVPPVQATRPQPATDRM